MKFKIAFFLSFILVLSCVNATEQPVIMYGTVDQHIKTLSSDDMNGRDAYSEDIKKAEQYIAGQMAEAGLSEFSKFPGYKHEFRRYVTKVEQENSSLKINGNIVDAVINSDNDVELNNLTESKINEMFEVKTYDNGESFQADVRNLLRYQQNTWVWIDKDLESWIPRLKRFMSRGSITNEPIEPTKNVFVLAVKPTGDISSIDLQIKMDPKNTLALTNTIGYIEGTDPILKDEYVVFSAHHDHVGVNPNADGDDKIFNGADDDASGVTAVLTLAKYFAAKKDNKRSLVFMTFTAEEKGGHGSKQMLVDMPFTAEQTVAMVNIEMVGKLSKWGESRAFLTGFERTDMGKIYQEAISDTTFFNVYPDPYPKEGLFFRSDNASFARQGIPAHTFSTVDLPNDTHYHKASDEYETINVQNMTDIIKGIADAVSTIVSGERTPTRVILAPNERN